MSFTAGTVAIMFVFEALVAIVCCFGWLHESEKLEDLQKKNSEFVRENEFLYKELAQTYKEIARLRSVISILKLNAEEDERGV